MPIDFKGAPVRGKHEITVEQFKKWIKAFDKDKDGRISSEELADAIRLAGGWFANWHAKRGLQAADSDHNGFIDESEFDNLVTFAEKRLGVKIILPKP